ncbi:MAG: CRISPR system precrRNA processing endoribonuclease RAMP protein Cas6 [Chloroflexota bacterium]|nr:CRISPR system precrRNA processing endoribonuclease RAMP protein Cas6 [Chloroflexota bacterium]
MLISLVVRLKPLGERGRALPPTTGPAIHGFFFHWLTGEKPEMASKLHDLNGPKPFTVSGVQRGLPQTDKPTDSANNSYWFRLTSMDEQLSELLLKRFGRNLPLHLEVLGSSFEIEEVTADSREHSWAATISWKELMNMSVADASSNPIGKAFKTQLFFYSPTTFKSEGRSLPLPLPNQTFRSLVTRWNNFSQLPLDPAFFDFLEEDLVISGYDLRSELALMEGSRRGAKLLCFRGWCEYSAFTSEIRWMQILRLMSYFAFFSGVGYKTTMGFGQTIALDLAR